MSYMVLMLKYSCSHDICKTDSDTILISKITEKYV